MNKTCLVRVILLIVMAVAVPCFGQETHITFSGSKAFFRFEGIEGWEFKPIQVGDKFGFDIGTASGPWGYFKPDGNYEIDPLFDKVCRFMHGYAPVKENGQWGIIDTSAEYVIKPAFDRVWSPPEPGQGPYGLTMVFYTDGIDPKDLYEADPLDDWTNGFNPGIFPLKKDDRWHLIGKDGEQIGYVTYEHMLPACDGRVAVFADERWGFVDLDGELVVPMQFYSVNSFKEGLAAVCYENYWGYIDVSGEYVIKVQYDQVEDFASGTAIVSRNEKVGLIDRKGRYLLKPEYDAIKDAPGQNRFRVCKGWSYGVVSLESGEILPIEFSDITFLADGSMIAFKDGQAGMFDENGKPLLQQVYTQMTDIGEGYLRLSGEDSITLYKPSEKEIIPTLYKSIGKFHNELAPFETQDGKWGFLDPKLKEVIPASYNWVTGFSWYQAAVEDKHGIKIIDNYGRIREKPRVTKVGLYPEGCLQIASFNDHYGVQDNAGKWLVRPEYDDYREFSGNTVLLKRVYSWLIYPSENFPAGSPVFDHVSYLIDKRCLVRSRGKYGYLDEFGKMIIPLQYDNATDMRNGMAAVMKDGLWGFIDKDGRQLQPHIYTMVLAQGDEGYVVYQDTKTGFISKTGKYLPVEAETLPPEKPDQK
ncbi:MAG: WG repeat-containing protein [Candidatus Riflebacteria bacterium]|nr:WG repeat-containing protein [Candidatus Riflebacteria bacterium]